MEIVTKTLRRAITLIGPVLPTLVIGEDKCGGVVERQSIMLKGVGNRSIWSKRIRLKMRSK